MRNDLRNFALLGASLMAGQAIAQSNLPVSPLCDLQTKTAPGEHRMVRVEGVYSSGKESQDLVSLGCSDQSTAIEFALKSHRLWSRLVKLSNPDNRVVVFFEGEFYGPPVPDPKLPPAILKQYHPGWDYNSKTKLVVHAIQSVKPAPPDSSVSGTTSHEAGHAKGTSTP